MEFPFRRLSSSLDKRSREAGVLDHLISGRTDLQSDLFLYDRTKRHLFSLSGIFLGQHGRYDCSFPAKFLYDVRAGVRRGHSVFYRPVSVPNPARTIYFTAGDDGHKGLFALEVESGEIKKLLGRGNNSSPRIAPDGKTIVFVRRS
ncbi:MAG: hypothetical protein GQ544_05380, partial [Candidatus Aminicenantes bacterium]|nr:hypothetical protein [Candidatus Aminicenantes bacterium]